MTRFLPLALLGCSFPLTVQDQQPNTLFHLDFGAGEDVLTGPYVVGSELTFWFDGARPEVRSMNPFVFTIEQRGDGYVTGTMLSEGTALLELSVDGEVERWVEIEGREAAWAEVVPNAALRSEQPFEHRLQVVEQGDVALIVRPYAQDGTPLAGSLPIDPVVSSGDARLEVEVGDSARPTAVHLTVLEPGTIELDLGPSVVAIDGIDAAAVDGVRVVGAEGPDGTTTELWGQALSGGEPVLGAPIAWIRDGQHRGSGDLYTYDVDTTVENVVVAQVGAYEVERTIHGYGGPRTSSQVSAGCSTVRSPLDLVSLLARR